MKPPYNAYVGRHTNSDRETLLRMYILQLECSFCRTKRPYPRAVNWPKIKIEGRASFKRCPIFSWRNHPQKRFHWKTATHRHRTASRNSDFRWWERKRRRWAFKWLTCNGCWCIAYAVSPRSRNFQIFGCKPRDTILIIIVRSFCAFSPQTTCLLFLRNEMT